MIRLAKVSEISEIMALIRACAMDMTSKGIYQWNEHYPSIHVFGKDIERGELWVLGMDDKIVGTIVISTFMDEEYRSVQWLTPNQNNIYIHRLAIHPAYQKQGKATKLMDFAEKKSRDTGFASIRLDTFSQNPGNNRFYLNRGYQPLGDIYFPKQSQSPFHCYELVL
ncbi:MAG: GNAT family N-acetyltransferase [Flavobacteriaceae bacterium]